MAVLHKYVPSSDQEGYYIYDAYDGINVTFQVSALARRVLDRLDSCEVDEQLPGEVFHTLHRLGLIFTRQSGVEQPEGLAEVSRSGSSNKLSPIERRTLFNELLSSDTLPIEERRELQEYAEKNGIKTEFGADLHRNWVPSPPDDNVYYGELKRTFQGGDWGFIASDEVDVGEDIFFHIEELEGMTLLPGMTVEFTYSENSEGYIASHVRRLTDSLGRDLEEGSERQQLGEHTSEDSDYVEISDLSEGNYVEAQIDRRKGQKGLGRKGYLHIEHRRASSDGYLHIATRDDFIPVNKWVDVQITAIHDGYAEAVMKPSPEDIEPPCYLP